MEKFIKQRRTQQLQILLIHINEIIYNFLINLHDVVILNLKGIVFLRCYLFNRIKRTYVFILQKVHRKIILTFNFRDIEEIKKKKNIILYIFFLYLRSIYLNNK